MKRLLAAILLSFALACPSVAQDKHTKVPVITQKRLDSVMHYWQHLLRLDNLEVAVYLMKLDEMPQQSIGFSHCEDIALTCVIGVLDPADYAKAAKGFEEPPLVGNAICKDIENTIVHELVHMRLTQMSKTMALSPACLESKLTCKKVEEAIVVRLTSALMDAQKPHLLPKY